MTGQEFKAGREALGLTQAQLAKPLQYGSQSRVAEIEGRDKAPGPAGVALAAFLAGYRPPDWPI